VIAPPDSHYLYFAYGSNMLSARLQARTPSARTAGIGQVRGHQLAWHKRGTGDGSGKCDLLLTGRDEDWAWGVLWHIHWDDKPHLDEAEALGRGYEEKQVPVMTGQGTVMAWTYWATDIDARLPVYDWYHAYVLAGAREHGLPADYVARIAAQPVLVDPDAMRRRERMALFDLAGADGRP
jgi:gamma-glutamylcyclotransferase